MKDINPVWISYPYARIRRVLETDRGLITAFNYQLEYDIQATPSAQHNPEWKTVARFDHNVDPNQGHDIREEGLHLDIYRDGEKYRVRRHFPYVPLERAPRFCVVFFQQNADNLLQQFERWHDLRGPWRHSSSE